MVGGLVGAAASPIAFRVGLQGPGAVHHQEAKSSQVQGDRSGHLDQGRPTTSQPANPTQVRARADPPISLRLPRNAL